MDASTSKRYDPGMPLPTPQLVALRGGINGHERRLARLREFIRLAEEEAAVHEALLALARNDRLLAAFGDLHEDAGLTSRFARDPQGYCRQEHIRLPEGVTLHPAERVEASVRLTGLLRHGAWEVEFTWDQEGGFSATPRNELPVELQRL
jgi:hypothetical protein